MGSGAFTWSTTWGLLTSGTGTLRRSVGVGLTAISIASSSGCDGCDDRATSTPSPSGSQGSRHAPSSDAPAGSSTAASAPSAAHSSHHARDGAPGSASASPTLASPGSGPTGAAPFLFERGWVDDVLYFASGADLHTIDAAAHAHSVRTASADIWTFAVSTDRRWIGAGLKNGHVDVWERDAAKPVIALAPSASSTTEQMMAIAFSPTGDYVAAGGEGVTVWDRSTGQEVGLLSFGGTALTGLRFDKSEQKVLASAMTGGAVWDRAKKSPLAEGDTTTGGTFRTALSPSEALIASADEAGHELALYSLQPFQKTRVLVQADDCDHHIDMAFSEDGSKLFVHTGLRGIKTFASPDYKPLVSFRTPPDIEPLWLSMSDDTKVVLVVTGEREASLWQAGPAKKKLQLATAPVDVHNWSLAPNGRWVAAVGDKTVVVWGTSDGAIVHTYPAP